MDVLANTPVDNTPTIDEFRPGVLRVLTDGEVRSVREIRTMVANHMGLSEQVRAERIASGQLRYVNRINWACSALRYAGLIERPSRGHYRITEDGRKVDRRNLAAYSEADMLEWSAWQRYQAEIVARKQSAAEPAIAKEGAADPIETMLGAERAFNAQTETELRQRLLKASPEFFEKAVIDLLWAMGYGGTHGEKQHLGGSGDGGIDGVIRQDALGLTNIYIQAKRFCEENTVGSKDIRNFIGALDSKGSTLGVFITTSSFSASAKDTANSYRHGKIVLIDGIKLTSLMLAYGVAVHKSHEYVLYEVDEDFFEEELG